MPAPRAPCAVCGSPAKLRAPAGPGADAETAELGALRRASYCVCIEGCSGSRAGDVRRFQISRLRALQPPANSWLGHVTADPPSASLRSGLQDQTVLDCQGLTARPAREPGRVGGAPGGTRAAERAGLNQKVVPSFLDLFLGCSSLKGKNQSFKEPGPASSRQRLTTLVITLVFVWLLVWALTPR